MRKFYLLFALLIGISSAAWADISGSWTSSPVSPWTTTAASNVPAGVTAVDNITATHSICVAQRQVKVSTAGNVTATFTYTSGDHALRILGVDLVAADGTVAYSEYVNYNIGTATTKSYELSNVAAGNYVLRFWVIHESGGNNLTKTNGNYTVTGVDEAYFDATNASCVVLKNKGNSKYATYTAANVLSGNTILTAATDLSVNAFFEIAAINGDGAANGYTIKVKNAENTYVYAISTGSADNNVGIKTVETIDAACKWAIKSNDVGAWYITPFGSSNGWNVRGTNTVDNVRYNGIGQWNYNYSENNRWYIMTPAEIVSTEIANDYVTCSTANKVGYPSATSTVATALKTALNAYESEESPNTIMALKTAVNNYMIETSDISMPEDGKAYTFTQVDYDGTKRYMKYAEAGMGFSSTASEATVFVCRKVADGQYAFVNNDGKYLAWKGNGSDGKNGANGGKGYVNSFDYAEDGDNDWANIAIAKLTAGNASDNKVGYVCLGGRRYLTSNSGRTYKRSCIIVKKATGGYDASGETATGITQYFNANFSSAFLIEDATYANTVTMKDFDGSNKIATFSAPFPTVVPANTTAYSVATETDTHVTEVSTYKVAEAGEAIPANTGVILLGTDAEVTMLPRTTETTVEIAEGALGNSAGAAKAINAPAKGTYNYVLAKKNDVWAFYLVASNATSLPMNKAYLTLGIEESAAVIRLNFGNSTGIELVGADAAAAQSKVYDLSGREVKAAAKGLYIVGGKKVIVK